MEVKQFYGISILIDSVETFEDVRKTCFSVLIAELGYRGNPDIALPDCFI